MASQLPIQTVSYSYFSLQLECCAKHRRASTEAIVEAIGVDAVEDGVGIAALIEQVVKLETEDEALELILCRGVEQGHAFVAVGSNLTAHMIVVHGEVENGDGKHVDGAAVGERCRRVPLIGKAREGVGADTCVNGGECGAMCGCS